MSNQDRTPDRRRFLKAGFTGLTAAALAPAAALGSEEAVPPAAPEKKKPVIVTRTLGRTGIKLPIISMGAQAEDKALYAAALDAGITHIDTAAGYMRGRHEELVAEVIKGRPRDSLVLCTKIYERFDQRTGLYPPEVTAAGFLEKAEISFKRLGVEVLDVLYLHDVPKAASAAHPPIMEAMQKLKKAGKVRFIGLSVHTREPEVIHAAVEAGIWDVILTSYNFKQPHAAEMKAALARATKAGIGIVAMKTQAGGFLDPERTKPVNHRAAIKWVLSDPRVATAIPGITTFDQLEMFLSIMGDTALTPQEKGDLDAARTQAGLYCLSCGVCVPQCPAGVQVPAYMRAYMYAYGYRDPGKAKGTLPPDWEGAPACVGCGSCRVTCAMGFDIRARLLDVDRVRRIPDGFLA